MRISFIAVLMLTMTNVQATDTVAAAADAEIAKGAPAKLLVAAGGDDIWDRYKQIIRGGVGCGDGICGGTSQGEDCVSCPSDCPTGFSPPACGDGVCSAADGENCVNCPSDCNGMQKGSPANRYCCGSGGGENPVPCSDARCTTSGFSCSDVPFEPWCCGDGVCDFGEECTVDGFQAEVCSGGVDEDCDGAVDCADTDCAADPACVCSIKGEACTDDNDCCSGRCRGKSGAKTCK